jgi:hypothetical protein
VDTEGERQQMHQEGDDPAQEVTVAACPRLDQHHLHCLQEQGMVPVQLQGDVEAGA